MTTAVTSIKASITPNPAYCFFLKPMLSSPCFSICRIYQHFSSQVMKPLKLILYSRFFNILYHQSVTNLLHFVAGIKFFYKAKGGERMMMRIYHQTAPFLLFLKSKKALQPQDDVSLGNRLPNQAIELRRMNFMNLNNRFSIGLDSY